MEEFENLVILEDSIKILDDDKIKDVIDFGDEIEYFKDKKSQALCLVFLN